MTKKTKLKIEFLTKFFLARHILTKIFWSKIQEHLKNHNFTKFRWIDSNFVPEKTENFFDVSGRQAKECDVVETAPAKVKPFSANFPSVKFGLSKGGPISCIWRIRT